MKFDKSQLEALGLSKGSINVFVKLAQNSQGLTVVQISKSLNLPRPTIYGYLDELVSIGIAKKGIKEDSSLYFAASIDIVRTLFDEKIDKFNLIKENISNFWSTSGNELYKPKFYVYEGKDAYKSIFRDILTEKKSADWYWPFKSMLDLIPESALQEFHRKRIRKGIKLRVLWPQKKKISKNSFKEIFMDSEKKNLREIKLLPNDLDQNMGYGIYGTKVAFISSSAEQYGFVVDSKELAESLRGQFQFIWKYSQKYN